ncbi:delta(14)-sterol reductase TM7SF2 [Maniola hyperantus]|uniref:delta(14)-sterol reductase TM7SF2 n=1 Tax=Aphantopus hyperantus TaxID=2795564 RepID=UPI00156A2725|nr:delta(14)-sterol reductase TM7SF2 [Maniola hyperantus]
MMSTRSGRTRQSIVEASPPRTRKGVSPTRSPARNRKSSPSERSSQKSPSRKSPSRKPAPKYPARKSPSRAVKETKEVKKEPNKSPSKRPAIKKDVEIKLEDVSAKIEFLRSTRTRRIEYSVADFSTSLPETDLPKTDLTSSEGLNGIEELEPRESFDTFSISLRNRRTIAETPPRRSSRLKDVVDSVPDIRRSFSKSLSKSVSKSISHSIGDYSEEEDVTEKSKSQSVSRKLATPLPSSTLSPLSNRCEFAGRIGVTALYLLIPLTVVFILISCLKACSYKTLKELVTYKNISFWFNTQATVLVISNLVLQTVFLFIPVMGTREVDDRGKKYYFNAFFSSFCTLNLLFGLDYYGILKNDTLLNSYLQMATVSYIIAVTLALTMFLNSHKVDENDWNPYGNSGYALYDFFIGREIHGVLLNINVKLWLARVSNISTLIFSILIFKQGFNFQEKEIISNILSLDELKNILNSVQFKPTVLVYSMMQIVYALYFIMREKKVVSTFYWNSEGLGYLQIVSSSLYPFYFTTISKYVADTDLQLKTNVLIAASILYLLGFLIMLISNNIKYEFRKNPLQPSLMHLNSMPTFHGKKLLLSNLWGVVRHPNYAGDMLVHAALAIPGIYSRQLIAAAPALITILMLLHRCWRDHARCRRRYGAAWLRYCKRVPSVIVPKVL